MNSLAKFGDYVTVTQNEKQLMLSCVTQPANAFVVFKFKDTSFENFESTSKESSIRLHLKAVCPFLKLNSDNVERLYLTLTQERLGCFC